MLIATGEPLLSHTHSHLDLENILVDASGFAFWVQETGGLASHEAAADFWSASGLGGGSEAAGSGAAVIGGGAFAALDAPAVLGRVELGGSYAALDGAVRVTCALLRAAGLRLRELRGQPFHVQATLAAAAAILLPRGPAQAFC